MTVYRNSINFLYSHFYILSIIFPIWTIYTFSILPPIATFYRLTIVSLYRHLYTKYIEITYNITYKGSLDFGMPVTVCQGSALRGGYCYIPEIQTEIIIYFGILNRSYESST